MLRKRCSEHHHGAGRRSGEPIDNMEVNQYEPWIVNITLRGSPYQVP